MTVLLTFFSIEGIGNIIQGLDLNEAHGLDKTSIYMLNICSNSICKPIEIIYRECLSLSLFPLESKKENIVPIHLPFEKMFQFFIEMKLIARNHYGLKPGDPLFINQLLTITHDIYKSFNKGYEVRGVFLEISEAFDNV